MKQLLKKLSILVWAISANYTVSKAQCFSEIAAGWHHTVAIKADGTLWAWGNNDFGALGNGTTTSVLTPTQIGTANNWAKISAGSAHTVAVKADGTLWAWGLNDEGQLGDGTTINRLSPVQIGTATNWAYIDAGIIHTLAIKIDGTLWAWGNNASGQLGDGTFSSKLIPTQIGTANNWAKVTANWDHTFGIKTDGTIWGWGLNDDGQLGDGTVVSKNTPTQIGTATNWVSVEISGASTIALKSDGTIWSWGWNQYGQLGNGTTNSSILPKQIGTATNWSKIAFDHVHAVAIKTDGTIWSWGNNSVGQLGDGTLVDKLSPTQIGTATDWSFVKVGSSQNFAQKQNGTFWVWGENVMGQLGDGTTVNKSSPVNIACPGGMPNPPTITSFTPLSAKPNDVVTITGTGFNANPNNNIIFFGATKAVVTAATSTSITVTVPIGATYSPITLLNISTSLACASLVNFNPIYSPAKTDFTGNDFSPKQDFATGAYPYSVAIGDLDGDGKADMALVNFDANTVSVFRNTSTVGNVNASSFATKRDFATGTRPYGIAIGDLDRDGKPDLVVTNESSNTISVYKNTSTIGIINASSFAAKQDFVTGLNPRSVAIGDLDGDGKPDLGVANRGGNTVSIFRNTSTVGIIGVSSFAAKQDFVAGTRPNSIAIGDLDNDGKPDLAVSNDITNNVSIFKNTTSVGSIVASSFATKQDFATGGSPRSVAIGDLDNDGKPDLAISNGGASTISVLRNTTTSGIIGTNSFATKQDFSTGAVPLSIVICDLNGDSKPDLVVANESSNSISILRNTSTTGSIVANSFATKRDFAVGSFPFSVAMGDLDGDNKPDLAFTMSGVNTVSVFRNTDISNTIWDGTSWSNGNPTLSIGAVIASNTAPSSFTCRTLTINNGFALNTTGITATINDNIINNGNGIAGTGGLIIAANSTLSGTAFSFNGGITVNSGATLTTNNLLTLSSNALNTARVDNSAGSINGLVTVQRFIPAKRAWRLLTAPLSGSGLSDVFVSNSWQQQTHIVGPSGTGLDAIKPGFNMLGYSNNNWVNINNTTNTTLFTSFNNASNKAFALFILGDRTIDLNNNTESNNTTLSATGRLLQGTQSFSLGTQTANTYHFIGNPYASPVDLNQVYLNAGTTNINRTFYTWDANLSSTGGYVTISWNGSSYDITPTTAQTQHIQSGQAFFVQATATANTTVVFEENDKSTSNINNVFGIANGNIDRLNINLQRIENGSLSNRDGVMASFGAAFSKQVLMNEDADKLFNNEEGITIKRGTSNLSIERRPFITNTNDTIFLSLNRLVPNTNYTLNLNAQGWDAGMQAFLVDKLLSTETAINLQSSSQDINITSATANANDRFMIVFRGTGNLPNNKLSLVATKKDRDVQLTWNMANEVGVKEYELQRSIDGINFQAINNQIVSNKIEYTYTDNRANNGTNYYRVKMIMLNDKESYSNTINLNMQASKFLVYPNPNKGKFFIDTKDILEIVITNVLGEVIQQKPINHPLSKLNYQLNPGIYFVKAINKNGEVQIKKLLIE